MKDRTAGGIQMQCMMITMKKISAGSSEVQHFDLLRHQYENQQQCL